MARRVQRWTVLRYAINRTVKETRNYIFSRTREQRQSSYRGDRRWPRMKRDCGAYAWYVGGIRVVVVPFDFSRVSKQPRTRTFQTELLLHRSLERTHRTIRAETLPLSVVDLPIIRRNENMHPNSPFRGRLVNSETRKLENTGIFGDTRGASPNRVSRHRERVFAMFPVIVSVLGRRIDRCTLTFDFLRYRSIGQR